MNLRVPEVQIVDLLVPWSVGISIVGFILTWIVMSLLERVGWTRFIWHLPLFFLGLLVLISCVLGRFLHP